MKPMALLSLEYLNMIKIQTYESSLSKSLNVLFQKGQGCNPSRFIWNNSKQFVRDAYNFYEEKADNGNI